MKKNGSRYGKQLWKCTECGKQFRQKSPSRKKQVWQEFTHGKQTHAQIVEKYGRSTKWVQRQLKGVEIHKKELAPDEVVIVMDTTYFRRLFGVMVWRCPHRKKNLLWKFLPYETIAAYKDGIEMLEAAGWKVRAIVCDGRRGLLKGFSVPVQMCHFHQAAIVTRYVTRRPKLEAGQDLQALMRFLPKVDEVQFTLWLELWYDKWGTFLKERTINELTGRWHYTHRRLRSAYYSVKRNLPNLFTYLRHPELNIPNTSNSLEGIFTHIKKNMRLHGGLRVPQKQPMIEEFLRAE